MTEGNASIREVMALLEGFRKELLAEVDKLNEKFDQRLEAHYVRHETDTEAHLGVHQREQDRRMGYVRWAVTTVMTGVGTLFAIVWAFVRGG